MNHETTVAIIKQFELEAKKYSLPITLHDKNNNIQSNGTMGFIQTAINSEMIGITANHVYEKSIKDNLSTCLFGFEFNLKQYLIDANTVLDIATFKMPLNLIGDLKLNAISNNFESWPPPPPQKGKGCFFSGFPGQEREAITPRYVNFGGVFLGGVIHGISDKHLTIHMDRSKFLKPESTLAENFDFGGVSGAPLFILYETPILQWGFGGVIYEGRNYGEDTIFYARPANVIRADGTLINN